MPMQKMTVRNVRGEINRAKKVYVFVEYSDHDDGVCTLQVSKPQAKEICEDAEDSGVEEICVDVVGKTLYIGDFDTSDEETEESADEEEEEEAEEETEPA
jgi:hypothetical protein